MAQGHLLSSSVCFVSSPFLFSPFCNLGFNMVSASTASQCGNGKTTNVSPRWADMCEDDDEDLPVMNWVNVSHGVWQQAGNAGAVEEAEQEDAAGPTYLPPSTRCQKIKGDGTCLFHSVAHFVTYIFGVRRRAPISAASVHRRCTLVSWTTFVERPCARGCVGKATQGVCRTMHGTLRNLMSGVGTLKR